MKKKIKDNIVIIGEALMQYSNWLHHHNYIDADYYVETPNAVERFIEEFYNTPTPSDN